VLIVGGNQSAAGGFNVANSLRFNDGSPDYLSKTYAGSGNRQKQTISVWVKRGNLGTGQNIFSVYYTASIWANFYFNSSDQLKYYNNGGAYDLTTNRLFRDSSAWYHLVIELNTTLATASDRIKMYVNGVQETSFASTTYPPLNAEVTFGDNYSHYVGTYNAGTDNFDGYMSQFYFTTNVAYDPTYFGEFDADSGVWKPIEVTGVTFNTNAFYLSFENSAALGQDDSGNGNNFTVNNIISTNQMTDTPTNNYCVANPLDNYYQESTFYEAGLKLRTKHPGVIYSYETYNTGTLGVTSGKWYWEIKVDAFDSGTSTIGIVDSVTTSSGTQLGQKTYGWSYNSGSGVENNGSSVSGTFASYTVGDIIGVYLDLDNNKLYFAKNGTIQNSGTGISITDPASTGGGFYMPAFGDYNAGNVTFDLNWGNSTLTIASSNTDANGYGNFEYDPSSGTFDGVSKDFYALNTKNLAEFG